MPIYDGHETLVGMSGANPTVVPRNQASRAVNRFFRYDTNDTRLPFRNIILEFPDDTSGNDRLLFAAGNIQGAFFYNAYPAFLKSYIIVSIAGTIFTIKVQGNKGTVAKLFEGNEPVFTHAWFAQGFEWLVIQDGSARPILWDGTNPARRAVDGEVPTGSVMAFIHGRLAVSSADGTNQVAVGDIVYGNDSTTTSDIINFTETTYWANGGAFGAPVYVGDINGLYAMPYLDTGTGQNELVVGGTEGAVSIDLSFPRSEWLDRNILKISLLGAGFASSHALAGMNGDLFYRGYEGVRSYRNARSEYQQQWKQTPISTDMRRWLDKDPRWLLQYASAVSWNNMLFVTTQGRVEQANNPFAGHHRFHRGFVVMDAEPESNTIREGASVWHGLWTGIRPVCFVEGRIEDQHRCFAFSYDCDGRNRLYEIKRDGIDDVLDNQPRKIISFYDTPLLGTIERVANNFDLKKLTGGVIELSNVQERLTVDMSYTVDDWVCYLPLHNFNPGCDCKQPEVCNDIFTQPRAHREHFPEAATNECIPGTDITGGFVYHTVVRTKMEGRGTVERMRVKFERQEDQDSVQCPSTECDNVTCCDEDDFEYHIATCGINTEVPVLPIPSDVDQSFTSTRSFIATCPPGSVGDSAFRTVTVISNISQADADQKALAQAQAQAVAALNCINCDSAELLRFIANSNDTDLSSFFQAGIYSENDYFRPFRLIELVTDIEYANGFVDTTGTLVIVWVLPGYCTYLNPGTFVFHDCGITDAHMSLQLACLTPSEGPAWPDTPLYLSP